ncbi:MAG: AraC family transcriptional regulator ligand-binding domain-containing protein [Hyphomicrobiales bacterium]|nr:AraC family transcriptional regulator ligand-binding domain-containing protein [Hyphomicrobiales bacterium]
MPPATLMSSRIEAREPYIRATAMGGFSEAVRAAGGDPRKFVEKVGLPPECLHDFDGLISLPRYCRMLEMAADELDRPSLALEIVCVSAQEGISRLGALIHLAHFVETLGEWIEAGLGYWRIHCNGASLQLIDDAEQDVVYLRCFYPYFETEPRQFTERLQAMMFEFVRRVSGISERCAIARFRHDAPADLSYHRRVFEGGVEFNARYNEIVLPRRYLNYKAKGNLTLLKPVVDHYIRSRIRNMPICDQTVAATVSVAITSAFGSKLCTIEFVAASLGWNVKKLQRALAAEGVTYSQLLEIVREKMARRLLSESDAPVGAIAEMLDYSATPPFTAAFRRWTGRSPVAFRKRSQADLRSQ